MGYTVSLDSYSTSSQFLVGQQVLVHDTSTNTVIRGRIKTLSWSTSTGPANFKYSVDYNIIRNARTATITVLSESQNVYSTDTLISSIITQFP